MLPNPTILRLKSKFSVYKMRLLYLVSALAVGAALAAPALEPNMKEITKFADDSSSLCGCRFGPCRCFPPRDPIDCVCYCHCTPVGVSS